MGFFRRRNDKTKNNRSNSPLNNTESAATTAATAATIESTAATDDTQKDPAITKERISEKIKKMGLDFFTEDFEGITVSSTKCLSCETITEQKETMIDLSVPITGYENMTTVENPQLFIQVSILQFLYCGFALI